MEIVRAAAKFEIFANRRTADRVRLDVMKLEKAPFCASAVGADERASAAVTFPYRSPYG